MPEIKIGDWTVSAENEELTFQSSGRWSSACWSAVAASRRSARERPEISTTIGRHTYVVRWER